MHESLAASNEESRSSALNIPRRSTAVRIVCYILAAGVVALTGTGLLLLTFALR